MSSLESLSPLQLTSLTDQYSNTTRQKHATYMNIHHGGWGVTMQEQRYNESRLRLGAFARKDVSFATQVVKFCFVKTPRVEDKHVFAGTRHASGPCLF